MPECSERIKDPSFPCSHKNRQFRPLKKTLEVQKTGKILDFVVIVILLKKVQKQVFMSVPV